MLPVCMTIKCKITQWVAAVYFSLWFQGEAAGKNLSTLFTGRNFVVHGGVSLCA